MRNKKTKKIIIIIFLLILIIVLGLFLYQVYGLNKETNINLKFSTNQVDLKDPNLISETKDEEYFELIGYGQLPIDKDNPNINLMNAKTNNVYLKFVVYENDQLLHETELIKAGKMEQFNVYEILDAGKHDLVYLIDVFDLQNNILWENIQQEQEIYITK